MYAGAAYTGAAYTAAAWVPTSRLVLCSSELPACIVFSLSIQMSKPSAGKLCHSLFVENLVHMAWLLQIGRNDLQLTGNGTAMQW